MKLYSVVTNIRVIIVLFGSFSICLVDLTVVNDQQTKYRIYHATNLIFLNPRHKATISFLLVTMIQVANFFASKYISISSYLFKLAVKNPVVPETVVSVSIVLDELLMKTPLLCGNVK